MDQDVSDELQVIHNKLETLTANVANLTTDVAVIRSNYATKADLAAFRTETAVEFGKVHERISIEAGRLDARIAQLEASLLRWFIATTLTAVAVSFTVAKCFG